MGASSRDTKFAKYFDLDAWWLQTKAGENSVALSQFYVIPALQGKGIGIGSIILKTLLAEAEAQNKAITLGVVKFNPAVRFYERHGFRVTHEDEYKFYITSKR